MKVRDWKLMDEWMQISGAKSLGMEEGKWLEMDGRQWLGINVVKGLGMDRGMDADQRHYDAKDGRR